MSEPALNLSDSAEILFQEGIIGVPRARRFYLLARPDSPIRFLDCLDIHGFRLPVVDPFLVDPGYAPRLGSRIADVLRADGPEATLMLAITTLTGDGAVANLRAPLIINVHHQRGVQVILDDGRYELAVPVPLEAQPVRS